jgi:hypothetical protein
VEDIIPSNYLPDIFSDGRGRKEISKFSQISIRRDFKDPEVPRGMTFPNINPVQCMSPVKQCPSTWIVFPLSSSGVGSVKYTL